jgi:hypothetical protein
MVDVVHAVPARSRTLKLAFSVIIIPAVHRSARLPPDGALLPSIPVRGIRLPVDQISSCTQRMTFGLALNLCWTKGSENSTEGDQSIQHRRLLDWTTSTLIERYHSQL